VRPPPLTTVVAYRQVQGRESLRTSPSPVRGGLRDPFTGAACLLRGLGMFATTPALWVLGLLPALLALVALAGLLVGLLLWLPAIVDALTPMAAGWSQVDRSALRLLLEVMLAVAALWLAIMSYTALTLAIGQPFYERIVRHVEAAEGGAPAEVRVPWWRAIGRAVRDGLLLVVLTACLGLGLLLVGLVPVAGETVAPVAGVCLTGFALAVELTGTALERRGLGLRDRLWLLWRRRLLALGFGVAVFLLFLLPFGAILGMPGAVAGGTLVARRLVEGMSRGR